MADFGLFKRGRRRNAVGKSGQMTAFLIFALKNQKEVFIMKNVDEIQVYFLLVLLKNAKKTLQKGIDK